MALRSIKFKLVVPRGDSAEAMRLRQAIAATHDFVNGAVAYYERVLLEMRQGDVSLGHDDDGNEVLLADAVWREDLRKRLVQNGYAAKRTDDALEVLRDAYRLIVPSSEKKGAGQGATGRGWHSPLVDPTSVGGEAAAANAKLLEPLLLHLEDEEKFRREAKRLIPAIDDQLGTTGRRPKWLDLYRDGSPEAFDRLLADLKRAQGKGSDASTIEVLKKKKILPLLPPFQKGRLASDESISKFERMALALAVQHMNSWESWGHIARAQYEKRKAALENWDERFRASHKDAIKAIAAYESSRTAKLRDTSLANEATQYKIRPRELRGWDRLREWLVGHGDATAEKRVEFVSELQARLGRSFGGAELLGWLAEPAQQRLATHPAGDVVSRIANRSVLEGVFDRTRPFPAFTFADAHAHPRYAAFDPPKNTNAPAFSIFSEDGRHHVELKLLAPNDKGLLEEENFRIPLAPTAQFLRAEVRSEAKSKQIIGAFASQDGMDRVEGRFGGANLLFQRRHLENTQASGGSFLAGDVGPVYLKAAIDIGADAASDLRRRSKAGYWFATACAGRKPIEKQPDIGPGFRVMGVDLGLRSAATVSVFQLCKPKTRKAHPRAQAAGFPARHERSAILTLPGEHTDAQETSRRLRAREELSYLRGEVRRLSLLRRAALEEGVADRTAALEAACEEDSSGRKSGVGAVAGGLSVGVRVSDERWAGESRAAYARAEKALGDEISAWRKANRRRRRDSLGGKSAWAIEHLTNTRRLLVSWHRHQRPEHEDVRRLDRATQGTVARRLLDHINNLRDDRVKTTADLIVQAARGLVYEDGAWHRRFEPVDVIVLEDLTRYRFLNDRPRAENRQLMAWAHREIAKTVAMQAEVYGIAVHDTGAAFSSRYDATTGCPGVRCHPVSASDLEKLLAGNEFWLRRVLEEARQPIRPDDLSPGDLVPSPGGALFASPDPKAANGLRVTHADVNAAQNIALRFLTGHDEAIRVPAWRASEGGDPGRFVSAKLGKRLASALGGHYAILQKRPGAEALYELEAVKTAQQAAKRLGVGVGDLSLEPEEEEGSALTEESEGLDLAELAAQEALREGQGNREVFFRDPSRQLFGGDWVPAKIFWSQVGQAVRSRLQGGSRRDG